MSDTNGNPSEIDPERLSAFYDGETSAEERASIEQLMDVSPDTLQTLDEYDQLSQSLRQLHQSTPSPDLREQVLERIGPAPSLRAPVAAPSSVGIRRMFSIAAGLAVAVMVLVLVWPDGQAPPVGDAGGAIAMNEAHQGVAAFDDASVPDAESFPGIASTGGARPHVEASLAMDAAEESLASLAEMEEGIDNTLSLATLLRKPALPEPGDVRRYLDGNANEITWVTVTVVDVQSAGDQVQLLLSQHGVQSPVPADTLMKERQQAGEQFIILVEAEWDKLEAVFVDLNDQAFVDAMEVNAPADEEVPEVLQGFQMARNSESGQAVSNRDRDMQMFRQRAQARTAPDAAARSAVGAAADAQLKGQSLAGAVQLQAAVPDEELQRLAARRGGRGEQADEPLDPLFAPAAASESTPSLAEETDPPIGTLLARPRNQKMVFVIRESDD